MKTLLTFGTSCPTPEPRQWESKLSRCTRSADVSRETFLFAEEGRCPFFDPNSKYHCTIYNGRASICRLFGASCSQDRFGNEVWKPCRFYPADALAMYDPPLAHHQYSADEIRKIFGATPPVISDLMEQEETFTPDDETRLVRDVLPERVQYLM